MAKGKLFEDTFEQLAELGKSTAKKTVKSVAQTLNPFSSLENGSSNPSQSLEKQGKKNNHTPLDFDKLNANYKKQEAGETAALRKHLFNLVKQGDERMIMEKRQIELNKKREENFSQQEKNKEEQKKKQQQSSDIPQGKTRRSVFSPKKVAKQQHAETKPATGKQ